MWQENVNNDKKQKILAVPPGNADAHGPDVSHKKIVRWRLTV